MSQEIVPSPVRWGILGTGRIARIFCSTLKALPQAQIYAVGSRSQETAERFGQEYHAEACYGSYEQLVLDPQVELVYVASPIGSHEQHVKLCLNAGKHVLCEKALTQSSAEAKELYDLAKEKQLFLMEAMWTKCQPAFLKVMEWKRNGSLGVIQGVEARFYTQATREHRLMKNRLQGGSLYDLTIYPLTYACALLGYEPKEVHALAAIDGDQVDVMESIQLLYENGSFASLTGGLACERQVSLYVHGTKGRILLESEHFFKAQRVTLTDWNNQPVETFDGTFQIDGYEYEALEAMACVRAGRTQSALVPMEETIQVIRLMEACQAQWSHIAPCR